MILIARSAARDIFKEIRRWSDQGLREAGSPLESLLYPLGALVPRGGLFCPLELCPLEAIKELVIDGAAIPPDTIKSFSSHNCHFEIPPGELEAANRRFNAAIDVQLQRRPRLAVLSKLHAHPFPGGAFLSAGDLYFGVNAPEAQGWRHRRGLGTAVLHVAYPDADPELSDRSWRLDAAGARCRGRSGRITRWRVRSWGLTRSGTMEDLGDARVVADRHPSVRAARRKPYWSTIRGGRWCDTQKRALRAAGHDVSRNTLGRGWRRYLIQGRRTIVVALPPDLPAVAPRVLEVVDASRDLFEPLEVPDQLTRGSLSALSLQQLVEHFTGPVRMTP